MAKCIVYAVSKNTTAAESMYHSTKLELMAIVWCHQTTALLSKYKIFDSYRLSSTHSYELKENTNPQIAIWATLMTEYD